MAARNKAADPVKPHCSPARADALGFARRTRLNDYRRWARRAPFPCPRFASERRCGASWRWRLGARLRAFRALMEHCGEPTQRSRSRREPT